MTAAGVGKGNHKNHARGAANHKFKGYPRKRDPRLYNLWVAIRNRCNNPNHQDYSYYGGRGIRVCRRWNNFNNFVADVGPHPGRGLTLDRKNTNRGYSPSNVRWATRRVQARNRNYCALSLTKAKYIRELYKTGQWRQVDLAASFGVSQVAISQVVRGVTW